MVRIIRKRVLLVISLAVLAAVSCNRDDGQLQEGRLITDSTGRKVTIPDTVSSVIALKSGALRLLSYMEVTDLVSHVEESERRRNVPYLFAHPRLRDMPVIGAGNNYDTELLAAARTDLIIATFMSKHEADRVQRVSRKPVVLLDYGDLGSGIDNLFASIDLLGDIFHKKERADSLVGFIRSTIDSCALRAAGATEKQRPAYIGGVAYNGAHGITSTEPSYPPFDILSVPNIAGALQQNDNALSHEVVFIDKEQLVDWDPPVLFLDAAGRQIWEQEISEQQVISSLSALRRGEAYTVLPYNWNTTNYENLLSNMWYTGTVMMPSAFGDIDYREKAREVFRFFHGVDIYDEVEAFYNPYRQLKNDIAE
ncbi:MAG: ABC transporter substrate-binding protein [Bacteroidales bacterium]